MSKGTWLNWLVHCYLSGIIACSTDYERMLPLPLLTILTKAMYRSARIFVLTSISTLDIQTPKKETFHPEILKIHGAFLLSLSVHIGSSGLWAFFPWDPDVAFVLWFEGPLTTWIRIHGSQLASSHRVLLDFDSQGVYFYCLQQGSGSVTPWNQPTLGSTAFWDYALRKVVYMESGVNY